MVTNHLVSQNGIVGQSDIFTGVLGESNSWFGVSGESDSYIGVSGRSVSHVGVSARSDDSYGLTARSDNFHAAYFRGDKEGGFADIVLLASGDNATGDNGVIMSDPSRDGSDLFMVANDAVVARIDNNKNGQGNFFVWDGEGTNLFQVNIDGDVLVKGSTVHGSDRNRKEQITDISYPKILQSIKEMPIYAWQYKGQDRRHIGPMAQDFHHAFNLGDDDKSIAAIDSDGVALAAIKAQQSIIEKQQAQIDLLKEELDDLKRVITSKPHNKKVKDTN